MEPAVCGILAGIASRCVTAPFDALKIRYQLQSYQDTPKYARLSAAVCLVLREEGLSGLWKGNVAGLYLYGTYSAVQFSVLSLVQTQRAGGDGALAAGMDGATAALVATATTYPLDLIRTRKTVSLEPAGSCDTARAILRAQGARGLYRGLPATLLQVVPYMGLVFGTHAWARERLLRATDSPGVADLVAGGLGGLVGKTVLMPVDVVRRRLQARGIAASVLPRLVSFESAAEAVRHTWRLEGIRAFYAGLSLALLKSVPASATTMLVYHALHRQAAAR